MITKILAGILILLIGIGGGLWLSRRMLKKYVDKINDVDLMLAQKKVFVTPGKNPIRTDILGREIKPAETKKLPTEEVKIKNDIQETKKEKEKEKVSSERKDKKPIPEEKKDKVAEDQKEEWTTGSEESEEQINEEKESEE